MLKFVHKNIYQQSFSQQSKQLEIIKVDKLIEDLWSKILLKQNVDTDSNYHKKYF